MKRVVAYLLALRYGVRGGLKPPLGFLDTVANRPPLPARIRYRIRLWWWRRMSRLYDWSGLPDRWHGWRDGV